MAEKVKHKYQIKNRDGKTCVTYKGEGCYYSPATLSEMRQNGYKLYIDGKLFEGDSNYI